MNRVLQTLELLDLIFGYTDSATDVACARVKKQFFEVSTNCIWYEVENLREIFSILAPIVKRETKETVIYVRYILVPRTHSQDFDRTSPESLESRTGIGFICTHQKYVTSP